MKFLGVLLNSNQDVLDGRYSVYSGDEDQPDEITSGDFAEDLDRDDPEPLPDMELEGD